MNRYLTRFKFFKNTPLTNFQDTIHFKSNKERDDFFLNQDHYDSFEFEFPFNFIKDRSSLVIPLDLIGYDGLRGVNYCTFKSEFESIRYYAFVVNYEYLNNGAVRLNLLIDTVMTFTQGRVLENLTNLTVHRQHLPTREYNQNLWELRNNDDVIKTHTKNYFYEDGYYFKDFIVLIHSSVDLTRDFGNTDNPKMQTAKGGWMDKVSSPLNIYMVKQSDFTDFTKKLAPYPWISQNLTNIMLMPKAFFRDNDFKKVSTQFNFNGLYEAINGIISKENDLNKDLEYLSMTPNDLMNLYNLDNEQDKHLLRSEYATFEIYTWDGQRLLIDLGQLNRYDGFQLVSEKIIGYENEIAMFVKNYKIDESIIKKRPDGSTPNTHSYHGSYLNDAIIFKNFDTLPVLVNNAKLGLANTANQRQLSESKLISNQIGTLFGQNKDADLKDQFYAGASLISNLTPTNLLGRFNEEYDYYRQKKAEYKDMALQTPTITEQTNSNSYQIKNENFGISIKASRPSYFEMENIKRYYNSMGFDWGRTNTSLFNVQSMSICNYIQFDGAIPLKNLEVGFEEQLKSLFSLGVRFWHNNGTANPMKQNINENKRVV